MFQPIYVAKEFIPKNTLIAIPMTFGIWIETPVTIAKENDHIFGVTNQDIEKDQILEHGIHYLATLNYEVGEA